MSNDKELFKYFEPFNNSEQLARNLKEGARSLAPVLVWSMDHEIVLHTHLCSFYLTNHSFDVTIPDEFDKTTFLKKLSDKKISEYLFSITLKKAILFFKAQIVTVESQVIRFSAPVSVFRIQRRKHHRFQIPEGRLMKVEVTSPSNSELKKRTIFDIGASGLSYILSEQEAAPYKIGSNVRVVLKIRTKVIKCKGVVKYKKPLQGDFPANSIKIGILFENISSDDVEFISTFVFDESRKYVVQFW